MTTNKTKRLNGALAAWVVAASVSAWASAAQAAVTIVITNSNGPGVGFNDPTPTAPVGGNPGATLGEQRLIAFQAAANTWGATLTSNVTVNINAKFSALSCTATSAILGSAGATEVFSDFPGALKADTWYPFALANKLSGVDQDPGAPQINANFNVNLGQPGCLTGTFFYLGLDNNHGANVDLVSVLLHEFAHGLGFQNFTSGASGATFFGQPSVWDHYLFDNTTNKRWVDMTDAERASSALNSRRLAWAGAQVTNAVPSVLSLGVPRLNISGPAAGATVGDHDVGAASFGPPLGALPVVGQLMPVVDQTDGNTGLACTPLNAANALAVNGRIALVDRGTCSFPVKVKNAQNAGAIGVVVADNVAGSPPAGLGGADPTVTIPSVRISLADGVALKAQLKRRSRTASGVIANLGVNGSQYAGADALGRALLYTPNPYQSGSSVSHWDTIAFPNLLMEPAINGDLVHSVIAPHDLTFKLLQDIGW